MNPTPSQLDREIASRPGIVSVIMPAHNEGRVIARSIEALIENATAESLEVLVVCNACTDDTVSVARSFGGCVRVIETDIASKTHALNLGDRAAAGFPRVYVDGDVILPAQSLWLIVEHLRSGRGLATAPQVKWDLNGASLAVRAFYAIDGRLPSSKEGIGGSGVYAMSEAGRKRFGEFPKITADDAFVRGHFQPSERQRTAGAYSIVTPPKNLAGVITIKTRSHYGNFEIAPHLPQLDGSKGPGNMPVLVTLALRPWLWPALGVYVYAKVNAKLRAFWQIRRGRAPRWQRDESSRMGRLANDAAVLTTPANCRNSPETSPLVPSPSGLSRSGNTAGLG